MARVPNSALRRPIARRLGPTRGPAGDRAAAALPAGGMAARSRVAPGPRETTARAGAVLLAEAAPQPDRGLLYERLGSAVARADRSPWTGGTRPLSRSTRRSSSDG